MVSTPDPAADSERPAAVQPDARTQEQLRVHLEALRILVSSLEHMDLPGLMFMAEASRIADEHHEVIVQAFQRTGSVRLLADQLIFSLPYEEAGRLASDTRSDQS